MSGIVFNVMEALGIFGMIVALGLTLRAEFQIREQKRREQSQRVK